MNEIVLSFTGGLCRAKSNLRISSDQVEYTNGTLYAPFGSSLVVTCEGGMGEKRWYYLDVSASKTYVGTDLSPIVYQSSGQLFLGDFQHIQEIDIFCEDESPSTVFTRLMEGVFNIPDIGASLRFALIDNVILNFQVLS